jgi:hypothetical protein
LEVVALAGRPRRFIPVAAFAAPAALAGRPRRFAGAFAELIDVLAPAAFAGRPRRFGAAPPAAALGAAAFAILPRRFAGPRLAVAFAAPAGLPRFAGALFAVDFLPAERVAPPLSSMSNSTNASFDALMNWDPFSPFTSMSDSPDSIFFRTPVTISFAPRSLPALTFISVPDSKTNLTLAISVCISSIRGQVLPPA